MLQFIIDFARKERQLLMAIGLIFSAIFFSSLVAPPNANGFSFGSEDAKVSPTDCFNSLTTFGNGDVKIRLYTDYFCPPCRTLESQIGPSLLKLVNKNVITLTFIDTPMNSDTPLYMRFFLYVLNEKKDIELALRVRDVLNNAARKDIKVQEDLEAHIKKFGIEFKRFDTKCVFNKFKFFLKSDDIRETPTCVIELSGKTETIIGNKDILSALKKLTK